MVQYVPDRNDIVVIDFDPTKGKEMGKLRPALVLSSREYSTLTGLMICCPISTSIRGSATEVVIDGLDKPSVVAASIIQTLSWTERKAKRIAKAKPGVLEQVLLRLIPLIGADQIFDKYVK